MHPSDCTYYGIYSIAVICGLPRGRCRSRIRTAGTGWSSHPDPFFLPATLPIDFFIPFPVSFSCLSFDFSFFFSFCLRFRFCDAELSLSESLDVEEDEDESPLLVLLDDEDDDDEEDDEHDESDSSDSDRCRFFPRSPSRSARPALSLSEAAAP